MKKTSAKKKTTNIVNLNPNAPKIEKGIPIPSSRGGISPFAFTLQMEVGDSFYLPRSKWNTKSASNGVRSFGYANDIQFTMRQDEGGVRVWRI